MNYIEVKKRVEEIANIAHNPEAAHILEDSLYQDFVWWVFDEAPSPFREVAAEVLKARGIDFARWYA